ncbi:Type II secretion system protein D [bacterium HR36]|nr:Type II secretion system protein D [bacterium HR36]
MRLRLGRVRYATAGMVAILVGLGYAAWALPQQPGTTNRGGGPDEVLTLGETIYVRAPSGLRIKEAATSRDGVVEVRPVPNKPNVLQIVGIGVGTTRLMLTDEKEQVANLLIAVEPDLQFIRQAVAKQFRRANVEITQGPDRTLIVGGTVDSAEDIDPLIRFLEGYAGAGRVTNNLRVVGPHMVQLEVIVAKVDRTELRRFGFNFLWSDQADYFGNTIGTLINPQTINLRGGVGTFAADRPIFDAATNILYGITDASSAFLGFVEALRREGLAKILTSPVLLARSGRPARITVGGEQPYPTPAALGQAPGVEFRRFGTIVQFLPVVLGDGRIRIQVRAEVSRLDFSQPVQISGTIVPRFLTQEEEATVELESGQSLVLGGLMQTEVDAATNKVPFIGDLPFIGAAFRRVQYEEREQELIILVTPRLVGGLWPHQRPICFPGQETRRPTDFELFLEGILEAPPGPRPLKPDGCYRPAHWIYGPPDRWGAHPPAEATLPSAKLLETHGPANTPSQKPSEPAIVPSVLPEASPRPPGLSEGTSDKREHNPSFVFPGPMPLPAATTELSASAGQPDQAEGAAAETVVVEPASPATLGKPVRRPLYRPLRED